MVAHLRGLADLYLDPAAPLSDRVFRSELIFGESVRIARARAPLGASCGMASDVAHGPRRLDPDRATFAKTQADFDPVPYLGVFSAACYLDPELLDRRRLPTGILPPIVPIPSGLQRGVKADILGYLRQWDAHGRLHLEAPWTTSRDQQGSLFSVPKSESKDRVVFNRMPRNAFEVHLPGYAKYSVSGHDLAEVVVPRCHFISLFSDDLANLPLVQGLPSASYQQRARLDLPDHGLHRHAGLQPAAAGLLSSSCPHAGTRAAVPSGAPYGRP